MSGPTTEAGRRHIDRWFTGGDNAETAIAEVIEIETEARMTDVERRRELREWRDELAVEFDRLPSE